MNDSNPCVIQTTGLAKTYKGVQALQPLDLQVREHSICGFLGPNGAGKTTTIKLLLGLARPTAGRGRVFGMVIVKENDEIRRRAGYLALGVPLPTWTPIIATILWCLLFAGVAIWRFRREEF